jgi:hypothetical protein
MVSSIGFLAGRWTSLLDFGIDSGSAAGIIASAGIFAFFPAALLFTASMLLTNFGPPASNGQPLRTAVAVTSGLLLVLCVYSLGYVIVQAGAELLRFPRLLAGGVINIVLGIILSSASVLMLAFRDAAAAANEPEADETTT